MSVVRIVCQAGLDGEDTDTAGHRPDPVPVPCLRCPSGSAGPLDQLPDRDEGGGEVAVGVNDLGVALGAAAQLAVAVHPRVHSLHHPAGAGLDRGLRCLLRAICPLEAQGVE
jgi:hypothetical protein